MPVASSHGLCTLCGFCQVSSGKGWVGVRLVGMRSGGRHFVGGNEVGFELRSLIWMPTWKSHLHYPVQVSVDEVVHCGIA